LSSRPFFTMGPSARTLKRFRRPTRTCRRLSGCLRLKAGLSRYVRFAWVPGGGRDHGVGRPRSRGGVFLSHVPNGRLPREHPEHQPEPAVAATPAQRAGVLGNARRANRIGRVAFFSAPVSERLRLVRCVHTRRGTGLRPRMRNRPEYRHAEVFVHLPRIHGKERQAVS
jgi:hypothetical protein